MKRSCGTMYHWRVPQVRAKLMARDRPLSSLVDANRELWARHPRAAQYLMKMHVAASQHGPEGHDVGDTSPEVHTLKATSYYDTVKPQCPDGHPCPTDALNEGMDPQKEDIWPQRELFASDMKAWCKANKKTHRAFAEMLGISLSHLQGCMYRHDRRMSIDTLTKAALILGTHTANYLDPAGAALEITTEWASPVARFLATGIFKAFNARDLTDEERQHLAERLHKDLETLRRFKKSGSADSEG